MLTEISGGDKGYHIIELLPFRACFSMRCTMKMLVSRKRSAQLDIQSVSLELNLFWGFPMHLSQHLSVSLEMICCTAAFWFSSWMNACIAAVARGSSVASMAVASWVRGRDCRRRRLAITMRRPPVEAALFDICLFLRSAYVHIAV